MDIVNCASAYANVFQLAGGIVLILTVFTRNLENVCLIAMIQVPIEGESIPGAERILFETYLARFGFCYLVIGYIPAILGSQATGYIVFWGIVLLIALCIVAWYASKHCVSIQQSKLKDASSKVLNTNGNVWISNAETEDHNLHN